ncbi:MAG: hypothetical protein JJU16_01315 [Alkalibacterium sp.]|nr:hypothetical protein [Alkalibacterium sp.]
MKLNDKLIYVCGVISTLLLGLLVVGGVALFLIARIDTATNTHAQREAARLAELPKEERPVEFIIRTIDTGRLYGRVHWGTSDDSSEGVIIFYENDDGSISLSESRSEFPQGLKYSEEMMTAIELELESSR